MARTFEIDTDGGWTMVARIIHRLIVSLTFAAMTLAAGQIFAQGASPAQPPGQAVAPASDASPSPSANGATPSNAACMKGLVALGKEVVERDRPFKAAGDGHAPPNEVCKLIGKFGQSEIKMIKYIEVNAAKCGIPPQIGDQLKAGHKNTEAMQKKVCGVAQQAQTQRPAGPSLSEVLGSSTSAPEATPTQKGGSTFDTLNGNVLTR